MAYHGIKLSASAICMNWLDLSRDLDAMKRFEVDTLHYDICDSYFVPDFGLPFSLVAQLRDACSIPSHYHLMVTEPKRVYESIPAEEGARVSIHYEACRNLHRDLVALRRLGFTPGLVINPATTLEHIEYVVEEVDLLTVMTGNPGFASQKMIPQTLKKIEGLREWRQRVGYALDIVVAGSVSLANVAQLVAAGADVLVLGAHALFVADAPLDESFERLKAAIDEGLAERGGT